ncbi:hypothetical protein EK904_004402 [Melospiza melodia maxima]|nr:hypothetical protein EK904_004402 [Melospiza melodia maxima]
MLLTDEDAGRKVCSEKAVLKAGPAQINLPYGQEAWHLLACVMGTREVWALVCAFLVILQKALSEVQVGYQMALLNRRVGLSLTHLSSAVIQRQFSITGACRAIQKLTRVRVVDNSALGNTPYHRPPKCIHVYNKTGVGKVGDKILLAIKGEKKKALIVGHKMPGPTMTPRFDSNNVVLIEDNGNPIGTRIRTPIPYTLRRREGEFSKVLAIARNFV